MTTCTKLKTILANVGQANSIHPNFKPYTTDKIKTLIDLCIYYSEKKWNNRSKQCFSWRYTAELWFVLKMLIRFSRDVEIDHRRLMEENISTCEGDVNNYPRISKSYDLYSTT